MTETAKVDDLSAAPAVDLRVAFATSDGEIVNQHFGSTRGFMIYTVSGALSARYSAKEFPADKRDGNEDKLIPRLAGLNGCDIVYCGSVGGSATKQLLALGVHPVMVKEGPEISELIMALQEELNGTPSALVERILRNKTGKDDDRFSDMEDDGWEE